MSVTVVTPKAELVEANRVVSGIIVLQDGVTPETMTEESIGRIMFEETAFAIGQGFNNGAKRKVYFEPGRVADLQATANALKLKAGVVLPKYKLIVKETYEPTFEGQEPKQYPGNSVYAGEPVTSRGALVYRTTYMVPAVSPEVDEYLPTDRRAIEDAGAGMITTAEEPVTEVVEEVVEEVVAEVEPGVSREDAEA